jgi:hypothetical protein
VTRAVDPLEYVYRTVLKTGAVTDTQIEIDCDVGASYTQLFGRIYWSPHVHTTFFADSLTAFLKSRVNRHTIRRAWIRINHFDLRPQLRRYVSP